MLAALADVPDAEDHAGEFVREPVQALSGEADGTFLIGVSAAEVVADRVEDDQADVANHERGLFEPWLLEVLDRAHFDPVEADSAERLLLDHAASGESAARLATTSASSSTRIAKAKPVSPPSSAS